MFKNNQVPDWMTRKAPPNYIAGLGRGATGFTTRSDIGPARETPALENEGVAKKAAEDPMLKSTRGDDEGDDDGEQYQDPDNETGLFASLPYEADDEEADKIYEEIDAKMDERRRARREAREREELAKYRAERPKIQQQFADLKRGLANVSEDEWANIPAVGDLVRRKGRKFSANIKDKFTPVPDSILAPKNPGYVNSLDAAQQELGGLATPAAPSSGMLTDFVQFGQARDKVLGLKLDQISDSVSGKSTVDPKGYLTDLNSIVVKSDAEISDIKKARTLLKSVITTNPKNAPGWIAAARLEEVAGKLVAAREIIAKGCEECSKSEDVWIEAARLNTVQNAKIILANAVLSLPQSVNIWLRAVALETEPKAKKRVLRRALEYLPNSVKIWKAAISLEEDPEDARILLSRAVECVPLSVELWLALARLETYENAKKVLNRARMQIPTSHEIWLSAAKLEEQQGNDAMVDKIVARAVVDLSQKGSVLDREEWLQEAEKCEKEGAVGTCQAIVKAAVGMGVEDEDRKATWIDDAEGAISRGSVATARAIYAYAIKTFPGKKSIWRRAAELEKAHGTRESLEELLQRAVKHVPQAEVLWLMWAKEKWLANDIQGARNVLEMAFEANPNSEQIWLAATKLEFETGQVHRARIILEKARESAGTERVWMKSAVLERRLENLDGAKALLEQALQLYPRFDKLHMIRGQVEEDKGDLAAARKAYAEGIEKCRKSVPLYLLASRLEEKAGLAIRARAILENARLLIPNQPDLWLESVRVEARAGNASMANQLMARALQECPTSGRLWSEAIILESRPQRKSRSTDAVKRCQEDPHVALTIARLFWADRKIDKARNWFKRAVEFDSDLGDAWAWYLKFEMEHGKEENQRAVISRCVAAEPAHGEKWVAVSKDMRNGRKSIEEILILVATGLSNDL